MMKKLIVLVLGVLLGFGTKGQQLSSNANVSVLSVSPGHEELYAAFGHSAIRIVDPQHGLDKVYNFGTYYYNQPHFYLNFARGYLLYGLSVSTYERFQTYYAYFNRQVTSQHLNLSAEQIQEVFDFLENNARPENSMYYYDYFYDNCATRIRDVFIQVLKEDIMFPEHFSQNPGKTIRQLTDHYIEEEFPWGKLGIDLCLGLPMDKVITDNEYMYLPDYLYSGIKASQVRKDSVWVSTVDSERVILESRPMIYPMPWFTPFIAFSGLLILGVIMLLVQVRRGILFRWFDFSIFLLIGAIGTLLFLLWVATDHNAAANNFNILWAIPPHAVVAFALLRKKTKRWVNWYLALFIPFSLFLIVFWNLFPQDLNEAFIPVVILLIVRAIAVLKR